MAQYIDKDAVLAEIERRIKINKECMLGLKNLDYYQGKVDALNDTISFLDTLEVKEVDIEKELSTYLEVVKATDEDIDFVDFAKHFYELGVNASNPLTWEDMMLIHKCIKDAMNYHLYKMMEGMEGQKIVYQEVLKRFKAQKGEKV